MEPGYWLGIFIVLVIIEIATLGLTTIWFAGGALVAFLASLAGANLGVQLILFLLFSFLFLFFTRPIAVKYINKDRAKTNVNAIIGKTGLVIDEIDNRKVTGLVSIDGMEWTARSTKDDVAIPKDKLIEVIKVSGVKVIVDIKEEEEV